MAKLFILYWMVSGMVSLFWGCVVINKPENHKKFRQDVKELAEESEIPIEIMYGIVYASFVLFGFIGVPVAIFNRIKDKVRKG